MAIERSELTWNYKPTDLLELPYESERGEVKLRVANGIAVVILPGTQPDGSEEKELHEWVRLVLTVRALQVTRVFTLDDHPSVIEIDEKGRRHAYLRATAGAVTVAAGQLEFIQTDAFGRIVRDSRKERQEAQKNELSDLSAKALNHPIVGHLLKSFLAALSEPSVEFVRLYEVRDSLSAFYGNEQRARLSLGITKSEWSDFGRLANDEPVREGRHNGKHSDSLRSATADERAFMRRVAGQWIRKFASTL